MQTHEVKRNTPQKKHVQIGRGGRRGKMSGRGGKGQTARAGNKRRSAMRDVIKKLPKLRGYRFASIQKDFFPINLDTLETKFEAGQEVTPKTLIEKGVLATKSARVPRVKILARGTLSKKLSVSGCVVSEAAKTAIEKVGGSVA